MNLKTTLVLLVCVAAGAALFWLGPRLAPSLRLAPPPAPAASGETQRILDEELTADQLRSIEVVRRGEPRVQLDRGADGTWSLPGNWPTRQAEVKNLVALLTGLRSRFDPIPVTADADLKPYGLAEPAVTVTLGTGQKEYRLALGEPPASAEGAAEAGDHSPFARPTYLRLADVPEIIRLAPGLVAALDRPVDYYQQRRLFPAERVAKEGESGEKEERLSAKGLSVKDKSGPDYTLTRDGDEWHLSAPVRDHVDPDKLKTILTDVPDIWAESFVTEKKSLADYGLKEPEQTLQVTLPDGKAMTLLVGKMSHMKVRKVMKPSPPGLPVPPQPEIVHDEYRYAKLQDNDQVFEIRAEHLKDLFVAADTVRDARLARFRTEDATRLEIDHDGQKPIVLAKDKDRWKLEAPLQADAESSKVTELLDKVSGLQARDKDIIDKPDTKKYGLDKPSATVKVTAEEEVKGSKDKKKVTKTYTLLLGKHDAGKLYVKVEDWPRVNAVEEALLPLVQRPALAYRGRRVLDFVAGDVDTIQVRRGGETVALKQNEGKWRLAEPAAGDGDESKAFQLADDLGRLEAVEYVRESAKPDELGPEYGLGKPALAVTVTFRDKKKPARTLLVGKQRPGKEQYFAKLEGSDGVFAVKKDAHDLLDKDALAYLPLQLPRLQPDEIAELRVQRQGEDEYRLTHQTAGWKVTAPFEAAVLPTMVQPMTDEMANLHIQRYEALAAKDLAAYGLDKPHLRVTAVLKPQKDAAGKETPRQRVLLVGKASEKDPGGRFAKLGDGAAVFVVGGPVLGAVDHGALDLLDRQLLVLDPGSIERLKDQGGDKPLTLQKDKDGWKVAESPAPPFAADRDAVDAVLNTLTSLRAERFAAYGPKADPARYGLDKPATTVTVSVKAKPPEHTLELGKPVESEAGARYARLDKGPGVVVLAAPAVKELTQTYLDFVPRTVLEFDPTAVTSLAVRKGTETVEVVKRDDGWALVKPADQPGDEQAVQEVLRQLTGKSKAVAAYPAKDRTPFGLEPPAAVVTLRLTGADGKAKDLVLNVGKEADGGRYAQAVGSQAVLVLPAPLAEALLAGPLGFRSRNVAQFVDADRAVLERGPRKAVFTKVDGTWKLTEPVQAEAEHTELENLVNAVARLRAAALVAEKPTEAQLKNYGLDQPAEQWHFQEDSKDVLALQLGRREKGGGRCYARLAKGDLVFVLDAALAGKLFAEYRKRDAWDPPLDSAQAERLTYRRGDTAFTLEKGAGGWQLQGKPSAKVNAEAVSDALAAIAGLKAERFVVDKGADFKLYGLAPAELVIEVQTPSGARALHVGRPEGESKRYYARVPEKDRSDVFVIGEADAARIVRDLPAFVR
jgi:hypothetical protein